MSVDEQTCCECQVQMVDFGLDKSFKFKMPAMSLKPDLYVCFDCAPHTFLRESQFSREATKTALILSYQHMRPKRMVEDIPDVTSGFSEEEAQYLAKLAFHMGAHLFHEEVWDEQEDSQ